MFTGLVEGAGVFLRKQESAGGLRIWVESSIFAASEVEIGESVAVNGCCLTVAGFSEDEDEDGDACAFDLLEQTLRVTNLGGVVPGEKLNLERAMRAGDRFGGHFVQGHVDGTARVRGWGPVGGDWRLEVEWDLLDGGIVLPKGSITLDGVSLTAAEAGPNFAVCWIIPYTRSVTSFSERKVGDLMNVEFDLLGKYVRGAMPVVTL